MANSDAGMAAPFPRLVFSTDHLPAGVDDQARLRFWRDLQAEIFGSLEVAYATEQPFSARAEFASFGTVGIGQFAGTVASIVRTARGAAHDGRDEFALTRSSATFLLTQRDRDALMVPGSGTLLSHAGAWGAQLEPGTDLLTVSIPRRQLLDLVPGAEDLVARPFDHTLPAVRHLMRYLDLLLGPDGIDDDPLLTAHVETTLLDLIALALGAGRDAADMAAMRGLRAARLQAVLTEIKAGFADPAFSAHDVARRLGLSSRYIQDLLQESGASFSERVLELRLQKARAMLASLRYGRAQISQIAYACGFNQVPYFNRCFRRRFGAAPTNYRGGVWV